MVITLVVVDMTVVVVDMTVVVVDMIVVVKMAMVMMVKVNCHHCWHQQLGMGIRL